MTATSEATVSDSATATSVLPLKRYKFLAVKIESTTTGSQANCDCETPQTQLNKSLLRCMNQDSQMHFITDMNAVPHYDCLAADTALDLLAAPASQAYIECVFSVCGLLGRPER